MRWGPSSWLGLWRAKGWRSLLPHFQSQTQSPQLCSWGPGSLVFSEDGLTRWGKLPSLPWFSKPCEPTKASLFMQASFGEVPTMCQGLGWELGADLGNQDKVLSSRGS